MAARAPSSRKDAKRSRRAILDAAQDLLQANEHASYAEIARAAGVGQATVYRHFPDRAELIAALLGEAIDRLELAAVADPQDSSTFTQLLRAVITEQARCQGLISAIREDASGRIRVEELRRRLLDLFREPFAEARRAGAVRVDLSLEEVPLLLAMVDGALAQVSDPVGRGQTSARAIELLLDGVLPRR